MVVTILVNVVSKEKALIRVFLSLYLVSAPDNPI